MNDIVLKLAGVEPGSDLAAVAAKRADIFELTAKTHEAALRPAVAGGLSRGLRAAIACRIARHNGDDAFAGQMLRELDLAMPTDAERQLADLANVGSDDRTRALVRHADLLAANPKAATGADIKAVKQAGVAEADIVRLSELVAFISYEVRVVAGLRMMRGAA